MWSKQREEFEPRQQQPEPVRSGLGQSFASLVQPPKSTAAIGATMKMKGEIRAKEELLVDGDVEGVMESESLVTIGPNGKVRANIKAREVVIFGSVRGDVEVAEKIAIREQGSLIGNIKSAGISIDDGAYFKGSIDIVRSTPKKEENEPKVAVALA